MYNVHAIINLTNAMERVQEYTTDNIEDLLYALRVAFPQASSFVFTITVVPGADQ